MPLSVEQFTQRVVESTLMSVDDVRVSIASLPRESRPRDGEQLARELVRQKKLTAFQAQQIYGGKAKNLVLGNYVLLDKLGEGGMGMVLKARHRRMDRLVALKILSPNVTKSEDALRRFHREVKAAARLHHPNIVMAFDADESGNTHFLVMEYVDGVDLSTRVKRHGAAPADQAVQCILQAARGLAYAHSQGVVHRDIKPANLLLDSHGVVKILDMGLARLDATALGQDDLTGSGQIMGTIDYMSPEQAMNTKQADERSDIYSLGMTWFYLLTGRPAYEGSTMVEKLMAHQTRPVPSLASLRSDLPARYDSVFRRMVAKRPEDRFQSMSELIVALESCMTNESAEDPAEGMASPDSLLSSSALGASLTLNTDVLAALPPVATELEQTVALASPASDTKIQAPPPPVMSFVPGRSTMRRRVRASRPPWWQNPILWMGAGSTAVMLLLMAIWVIIRDKDGNEVGRMKLPDGGSVSVKSDGAAAASPAELPANSAAAPNGPAVSTPSNPAPAAAFSGNLGRWQPLFDGFSLTGWSGATQVYAIEPDGPNRKLVALGQPGLMWTNKQYGDFELSCEFRVENQANNGIGLRYSGAGDPSKNGIEIQLLDDEGAGGSKLRSEVRCGAIFGHRGALSGYVKRWPDWNLMTVLCAGDRVQVNLNGQEVTTADLSELRRQKPSDLGLMRTAGHICLFPLNGRTEFRELRIREVVP